MKYKNILVQGAMDCEIEYFIKSLTDVEKINISSYDFYKGKIGNIDIIVSKTLMGTINSTMATIIGINTFKPDLVINQGIAGSHKRNINVGDIIIGESCCNINSYSMPAKGKGEGSNPFEWEVNKRDKEKILADKELVELFKRKLPLYCNNKVYVGSIGSGDVFNRETDRIDWISQKMFTDCEEMESIGVYTVCQKMKIPCIGIRIISNNELTGKELDENQAEILQKNIIKFLKAIDL